MQHPLWGPLIERCLAAWQLQHGGAPLRWGLFSLPNAEANPLQREVFLDLYVQVRSSRNTAAAAVAAAAAARLVAVAAAAGPVAVATGAPAATGTVAATAARGLHNTAATAG